MFTELIVTFIFVFALLMLNFPQLQHDEIIKQKMYLFTSIFIFNLVGSLSISFFQRKIINIRKILKNSFQTGLLAVIGYSIYRDLEDTPVDNIATNLKTSLIIIVFVATGSVFEWLVTNKNADINDCLNLIYKQKS